MTLTARTEVLERDVIVLLTGTIDRDAGPVLDEVAASTAGTEVVELDVTEVDYINSSGIALLVGLLSRARAAGTALRVTGLTPHYRHIFAITRLDDFIEIVEPAGRPS